MRLENQVYRLYAFECNGNYGEQALLTSDVYLTAYISSEGWLVVCLGSFLQSWKVQGSKYSTKSINGLASWNT